MKRVSRSIVHATVIVALCAPFGACHRHRPPVLSIPPPAGEGARAGASGRDTGEGRDVQILPGDNSFSGVDVGTGEGGPLADVRFEYDSASLTPAAQEQLRSHALWLQDHPGTRAVLEGHCDERGTVEYNLALGEQRARAVSEYLSSLGVDATRLRTASFGKERPLDTGHDETAWAKNRRVHLAVSSARP
jgi:peptidoglycan-associated lipoprotein